MFDSFIFDFIELPLAILLLQVALLFQSQHFIAIPHAILDTMVDEIICSVYISENRVHLLFNLVCIFTSKYLSKLRRDHMVAPVKGFKSKLMTHELAEILAI